MLQFKVGDRVVPSRFLLCEVLNRWTMLTQRETEVCIGDQEKLVRLLETRCGFARKRAEQEVEVFLGEFQDKILRAA